MTSLADPTGGSTQGAEVSAAVRKGIDTLLASASRAPAVVAGVIRDGQLVHVAAAGEPVGVAPASVQSRIGSISKTFTATLVLALRDEGAIGSLDDPIGAYVPGVGEPVASLKLARLLDHTSGLCGEPDGPWWERNPGVGVPELVARIGPQSAIHRPGTTFHYSNLGYGLLGAAVATAAGTSWAEALRTRILVPLGMDRTTYAEQAPYLPGYVVHPDSGARREEPREDSRAMAPAGQLWSTVADLARWGAWIADPASAPGILAPETAEQACVPTVIADRESWSSGHSLSYEMWRAGNRIYLGHTGSMPGYLAVLMIHRPTRTGVVALANAYSLGAGSIYRLGRDLLTTLLDGRAPAVAGTLPTPAPRPAVASPALAPLVGAWWWMGIRFEAYADGDEIVIREAQRPYLAPWRFTRTGTDTWRCHSGDADGETMTVLRSPDGTPEALDIATYVLLRDDWPQHVR